MWTLKRIFMIISLCSAERYTVDRHHTAELRLGSVRNQYINYFRIIQKITAGCIQMELIRDLALWQILEEIKTEIVFEDPAVAKTQTDTPMC